MLIARILLILLCLHGLAQVASSQSSEPWVEKALAFAEEIEPQIFSEAPDYQVFLGNEASALPVDERISAYQDVAFMCAMALNVEPSEQVTAKYAELLNEHGTERHHTIQETIDIANGLSRSGNYAKAEQELTRLAIAASDDPVSSLIVHIALAYIQYDNGSVSAALRSMQRARQFSQSFEQSPIIAIELEKLSAYVFLQSGAQEAVIDAYRDSWAIHKQHGFAYESSEILSNIGWMLRQAGDVDASRTINQKVLAAIDETVSPRRRFFAYLDCGAIGLQGKNYRTALSCLKQAEAYLDAVPERRTSWEILHIRALARSGNADLAKSKFDAFIANPKTHASGYASARLPFLETEILFASGEAASAYEKLVDIREDERIKNARDGHAASAELRRLLEQKTAEIVEKAQLKESLLKRQRYITALTIAFSALLIILCFYLVHNRRREQKLAVTDPLTNVLNRRGFWRLFEIEVERGPSLAGLKAIGVIDLDGFKSINDVYGHTAGDLVLIEVATRLRDILGSKATIGRLGGDEFAFLLDGQSSVEAIQRQGNQICAHLRQALDYEGATITPGASVGLAVFSEAEESAQDLYDCADYALYTKKRNEPGKAQVFDLAQRATLSRDREIETALFAADASEFYVAYQPIMDGQSGAVVGFQALARWSSARLGDIPPSTFIPIAERTSKIRTLSKAVVRDALGDAQSWPAEIGVSINLSSQDVASVSAVQSVVDEVIASKIDPARVTFELTETVIIHENGESQVALKRLSDLGVNISLGDFGTGSFSIKHLHAFPIDKIKIDQSVTRNLGRRAETASIVKLALNLCEILNVDCVVDGVEKPEQRRTLVGLGVKSLQGFLFAKPMVAEEIGAYLNSPKLNLVRQSRDTREAG